MGKAIPGRYHPSNIEEMVTVIDAPDGTAAVEAALDQIDGIADEGLIAFGRVTEEEDSQYEVRIKYIT